MKVSAFLLKKRYPILRFSLEKNEIADIIKGKKRSCVRENWRIENRLFVNSLVSVRCLINELSEFKCNDDNLCTIQISRIHRNCPAVGVSTLEFELKEVFLLTY